MIRLPNYNLSQHNPVTKQFHLKDCLVRTNHLLELGPYHSRRRYRPCIDKLKKREEVLEQLLPLTMQSTPMSQLKL